MIQLGDLQAKLSSRLMGEPANGVHNMVSRIYILFISCIPSPGCCFPSFSLSPVMKLTTQYSGWNERELSLFSIILHSGEARYSFICSHFPLLEKSQAEKGFWTQAVPPWSGERVVDKCKVKLFLLLPLMHPISDLFSPVVSWNISTGLPQRLTCLGEISKSVFSRVFWIVAERGSSQFMGLFRVCRWDQGLYTYHLVHEHEHSMSKIFLGLLVLWCWISHLLKRQFCPWMDAKLLLL